MPRPRKCRRVCRLPQVTELVPVPCPSAEPVLLQVDEYEVIRLIDLEGLTQEEAAAQMNVARTTAQAVYQKARKKLAECLVQGRRLQVSGGAVEVCGHGRRCPRSRTGCPCHKREE